MWNSLLEQESMPVPELNVGVGEENAFNIHCTPGNIVVWINSIEVVTIEFEEANPTQGGVFLMASTSDELDTEPHRVLFDDFYVNK